MRINEKSTVSEMKYALLKLGCTGILVAAKLEGSGVCMTVETHHMKIGPITVERVFSLAEYLGGPMQPIYFEIYRRVLAATQEAP